MWSDTLGLLQSYKSYFDDEIDEGFWLRYVETKLKFLPYKQIFGYPGIFVIFESI